MTGAERRRDIMRQLEATRDTNTPIAATTLAKKYGVSRQVIVQDIALIRANGIDVFATNRGYLVNASEKKPQRVFKVHHDGNRAAEEMETIVDLGGYIEDIFISHRVYGTVRGELRIGSRKAIKDFMDAMENSASKPLSDATNGYHYHTVTAESEELLDQIFEALKEKGFLAGLQEYEPVNFWV